jgi:hypothetical protein
MDTKEVIELLETAKNVSLDGDTHVAVSLIEKVLKELKSPRWYTPEQWKQRTGEKYPHEAPVWARSKCDLCWWIIDYDAVEDDDDMIILCAYNHLGPPPDDWRPV